MLTKYLGSIPFSLVTHDYHLNFSYQQIWSCFALMEVALRQECRAW